MADFKNIIMSLWNVPDAEPAELLILLTECFAIDSRSFQTAQAEMKLKYSPY
jgi:hypothetical protein